MREIKFQAWDLDAEQMYNWESIRQHFHEHLDQPRVKVRQYAGLNDKHGKEYYDGDILRNERGAILEVVFDGGCFYVEGYDPISNRNVNELLSLFATWSEIIGDKYRNPGLLEAAE
ncbi:YopX family protein [Bacillus sp. SB47]|uniref:YopX family protein n=1 Tax=Bacillus sp. SB47 TaxID=1071079 RepID=UPI00068519DB|nr:YopX family protein [Bacillus sp. SB47]